MKDLYIGASGGTAASMGACMEYTVNMNENGVFYFVPRMWRTMAGLTDLKLIRASKSMVDGWDKKGGSPIIPSCKDTNVFKIKGENGEITDMSDKVRQFCEGCEGVIVIGGGGTTAQSAALHQKQGLNFIVPLATMDNDIACFDNVLGFPTAVERSAASIDACSNDAQTMQRPTLVFSMGYECGRLAVAAVKYARKVYGTKIDMLVIPETGVAIEDVARQIKEKYKGGAFTIVVSEGTCKTEKGTDDGQHKKFGTADYAKRLIELTGIQFKVLTPDYMQRSGIPVAKDLELAKKFAAKVTELISAGKWNYVIGSIKGEITAMPIEKAIEVISKQNASSAWYTTPELSLDDVSDILIK